MDSSNLPLLVGDEARRIDLEVTEKLGRVRVLEIVAGRLSDALMYHFLSVDDEETPILFVAGKGNNGANAIAAARILHMRGRKTMVMTLVDIQNDHLRPNIREQTDLYKQFAGKNRILAFNVGVVETFEGLIVDGIFGTGISEPPRGKSKDAIRAINAAQKSNILSIDIPSGLNHISGEAPGDCVKATWTLNLHMLKSGQLEPHAKDYVGELWSAETGLGFTTFPGLMDKFASFYEKASIRKV